VTVQDPSASMPEATPIVFSGPIAIVGGGAVEPAFLDDLAERNIPLVGADGGGNSIGDAGYLPAAIIGDMDSLTDRGEWETRTRVIHLTEQDSTDFQKALYCTEAPVTLALGMTGKRLDHTLAALSAVLELADQRRILVVDEVDVAVALVGAIRFSAHPGERVSIFPFQPVSFASSSGLLYPLHGLDMAPGGVIGTSNAATDRVIEIVPADDQTPWFLILGKERVWDLVALLSHAPQ
jgi:thiamine pyrophosphokinase